MRTKSPQGRRTWMLPVGIALVALAVVVGFLTPPINMLGVIPGVILIAADEIVTAIRALRPVPTKRNPNPRAS